MNTGSLATAAVAARLRTVVAATANVYDMLGSPTTDATFAARYVNNQKIHAYEVTREGSVPVETESVQAIRRKEQVVILGYYGWQDGISEPVFQAEVDAILAAFDPPHLRDFDDVAPEAGIDWSEAPRAERVAIGRLGQVVVHFTRIVVTVDFYPIS